jgi:hypothetical protein
MNKKVLILLCLFTSSVSRAQDEEVDLLFTDEYARVLHATQSPFERSAQFDWSLGWFRYRGLGPEHTAYFVNGAKVNSILDKRIDWNRWGGLNDITRYPETVLYADASLLPSAVSGAQIIRTDTDKQRSLYRLTTSLADRSYSSRIMLTALHKMGEVNLLGSGSLRSAQTGYYTATPYTGRSGFIQLSLDRPLYAVKVLAMNTFTSRVSPEAQTREVWGLTNKRYNSSWGYDHSGARPLKPRLHKHQFYQIELARNINQLKMSAGAFNYIQRFERQNLSYQRAPNPFATYYRYLPSFFASRPFIQSRIIQNHKLEDGVDLNRLREANANSAFARYALLSDVRDSRQRAAYVSLSQERLSSRLGFWGQYTAETADHYQRLDDLLGAQYYLNRDLYDGVDYDLSTTVEKYPGDAVNYHYGLSARSLEFALNYQKSLTHFELSTQLYARSSRALRQALAEHELYQLEPEITSQSPATDAALSIVIKYFKSGQSEWRLRGFLERAHQTADSHYINARYSHLSDQPNADTFADIALHYFYQQPRFMAMLQSSFLNHYDAVANTYFFAESSDWQELVTQRLWGARLKAMEFSGSFQYELSTEMSLDGAFYLLYDRLRAPESVRLYLPNDSRSTAERPTYEIDLDPKGRYHGSSGPHRAVSLGLSYRSQNFWSLSLKSNYLSHAYIPVSWPHQSEKFKRELRSYGLYDSSQERLDGLFYLQLLLSKSWRTANGYLQLFASLSNITNTVKPIAGYASSRLLSPRDFAANQVYQPVFATKYWQNVGRNYFINLSYSFNSL